MNKSFSIIVIYASCSHVSTDGFQPLVRTSALRLLVAERVALAKWDQGTAVEDPQRETQVIIGAAKVDDIESAVRATVEDVNHVDGDPSKPFRDLYGYAISAKRYCLFEGKHVRKIVDSKAHGIGYLMSPIQGKRDKTEDQFAEAFWQLVLQNEGISFKREEPEWLDRPAIMRIPVSSPAVLGRLKDFCRPCDFVLAPVIRDGDLNLDEEAEKPILVTRFTKHSEEWSTATYYNVRTGEPHRITVAESTSKNIIPVRSYRSVLNSYVNNAESKFNGPDGKQCCSWTRGMLQRMHIVAGEHRYCGKEFKRKLEQGPVDHEIEFKCKIYQSGGVVADPEVLRQLAAFSERQIRKGCGVRRDTIRLLRHGRPVKRSTYEKIINFLRQCDANVPE